MSLGLLVTCECDNRTLMTITNVLKSEPSWWTNQLKSTLKTWMQRRATHREPYTIWLGFPGQKAGQDGTQPPSAATWLCSSLASAGLQWGVSAWPSGQPSLLKPVPALGGHDPSTAWLCAMSAQTSFQHLYTWNATVKVSDLFSDFWTALLRVTMEKAVQIA